MMEKPKEARGFGEFGQKNQCAKNASWREWMYSDLLEAARVVQSDRKHVIYFCLSHVN